MEVGTTCWRTARLFSGLKCNHPKNFKHAVLEGKCTKKSGFYTTIMAEYFINALYPGFVVHHVPAMPLEALETNPQPHRDNEPIEQPEPEPMIVESVDPMALAAEVDDDEAPADDEWEDHESREARLRREALSLEHLTLHDRKNPFCEFCQRGRMLKRYCKKIRAEDEDDEKVIHRATAFDDIIEADHMFPSQDARGLSEEQSALVIRDRYSDLVIVYPQSERTLDANHESFWHFAEGCCFHLRQCT